MVAVLGYGCAHLPQLAFRCRRLNLIRAKKTEEKKRAHRAIPASPPNLPVFSNFLRHFLKLDDLLGPWEYHRCHEVEEMIANDGIESSAGGM